jgi:hypothetical protein
MSKSQLHQLLAVEKDLKTKANLIAMETHKTFVSKSDHFDGIHKSYDAREEDGTQFEPEEKPMVTTVSEKLKYVQKSISNAIDAQISKEETNNSGEATGKLDIGGREVELSATALLALETQMQGIRAVYKAIPTLDPGKSWSQDKDTGKHVYVAPAEVKYRTEKQMEFRVVVAATKEHAAQVREIPSDKQVGKWTTIHRSGKLTTAQKSELLSRIDGLILSIKKARSKANEAEIKNTHIAEDIFKMMHKDII